MARKDLFIASSRSNSRIAVSTYLSIPGVNGSGPPAVIVMGHGIGAVKAAGLEPFAEVFNKEGYAAVTFDYISFGLSEGLPRNTMTVAGELQDFRDVVAWVRQQDDFDNKRLVVWGTSFGGMHVTALLSEDHEIAAGISQCPCVDGFAAVKKVPFLRSLQFMWIGLRDIISSFFYDEPVYIHLASDGSPGSPTAIMEGPHVIEGWRRIAPTDQSPFPNILAGRSLMNLSFSRPILSIHRSVKPYLFVLPTFDHEAPLGAAEEAVRLAPLGEMWRVPGGHFDLYHGGFAYEENIKGQIAFLKRVIEDMQTRVF
jgi:pimeloyl-ACP methyl ester carboxylesterase